VDLEEDGIEVVKEKVHSCVNIHPSLFDLVRYVIVAMKILLLYSRLQDGCPAACVKGVGISSGWPDTSVYLCKQ
jgi:hypothetical protein